MTVRWMGWVSRLGDDETDRTGTIGWQLAVGKLVVGHRVIGAMLRLQGAARSGAGAGPHLAHFIHLPFHSNFME